jgi:sulfatase modifying factor 1
MYLMLKHIQVKRTTLFCAVMILIVACDQPAPKVAGIVKPETSVKSAAISCIDGSMCKVRGRSLALMAQTNGRTLPANANNVEEMIHVSAGSFLMGSNDFEDSKPVHKVSLSSFLMDVHEVTNAEYAKFVKATGYITVAERPLNAKDFPGVPPEKLVPGSAVFVPPAQAVSLNDALLWWQYVAGASWKHPLGAASSIEGKDNDPVVQVCFEDAAAYAKWCGKRLPTEAEWEFAARAGRSPDKYYWGNELKPGGKWPANIFQGNFPNGNTLEDGFSNVAPVKSYAANPLGLYDMDGNVWEWCSDYYRPDSYLSSPANNPQGPASSMDPDEPGAIKHVQRGGSFICSDQYCIRYKAGSRGKGETSSAGNNLGFRCVKDLPN